MSPYFSLSNKIVFGGRVLLKIVRVSCFVDYQSSSTGILRHKASSEDSFGNESKFLLPSGSQYLFCQIVSFSQEERL